MREWKTKTNIRTCGINPNHWYVVALAKEVKDKPVAVELWHKKIVLFRDSKGKIRALENRCPHRQVKLSEGIVVGDEIECVYHGWRFNGEGKCSLVPYLRENQKMPSVTLKSYPVVELDGFVWLFPGDGDWETIKPMGVPEWEHLNYIASVAVIDCPGHFSFLIENLMDMYHVHLHKDYQAWANPRLKEIKTSEGRVDAIYEAESYYRIDKIWSISQLFIPALRRLHPEILQVSYIYPHWASSLGEDFKIYCLFCPIDETRTKAYLVHFTSLQAFKRLHKLPLWFRRLVKNSLFNSARGLLEGLVRQDIIMIRQEQEAFNQNPSERNYEINPTIARVQEVLLKQGQGT